MKIISGGQTGVDRAALDAAIAQGIAYAGWCPRGGWAEDCPDPPGLLAHYPLLRETPLRDPAQRTEWNVRDSDATMIIVDAAGLDVSRGTALARALAEKFLKPLMVVDLSQKGVTAQAETWLRALGSGIALGIGGPRESEAPGIYVTAHRFVLAMLRMI
jgi:hypothetical protein